MKADEYSNKLQMKQEAELHLLTEVEALKEEIHRRSELEGVLQGRVSSRERRILHLEEKINEMQHDYKTKAFFSEDFDNIRECLGQLRTSFNPLDQAHKILDSLEQSISDLIGRVIERAGSPLGRRRKQREGGDELHREKDKDKDRRRRHKEKNPSAHSASIGVGGDFVSRSSPTDVPGYVVDSDFTKVMCYMLSDKTETPYVTLVPTK